ncbi:MAG: nitroreductase family protein, partial [Aggregatilineales bacterium]
MSTAVFEAIRTKRAVRQFTDQPIPDEIVREILNAGRLSGSSKNTQPWHFVAVRNRDTLRALSEAGTYAGHIAGAALAV